MTATQDEALVAPPPYEPELTLDQVAARLRMKAVTLRKFLRRIRFEAIQGGDTLLFTAEDYLTIRDARRKSLSRSTGTAAAAGTAPASSADIERRAAKLRDEYWPKRSGSNAKRRVAAPARSVDVERRLQELRIENSGKHAKGKPSTKASSGRGQRVVPFPNPR
jgi:hypothetical protein